MTDLFARLYLDEDVSVQVAMLLRARGYDVVTTVETNRLGHQTGASWSFPRRRAASLSPTNRRDFESLAAVYFENGIAYAGLIIAVRRPPKSITDRIAKILDRFSADEMRD